MRRTRLHAKLSIARRLTIGVILLTIPLIFGISCFAPALITVEPEIVGFAFASATVTIPVGTAVTWAHKNSALHTVATREPLFDSGNLSRSDTSEQSGTFGYYCTIHPSMTGKIIVE